MKRELIDMLCKKSFQYSEEPVFKLVSGRMSHFYVNCKPTTLHPRGMYLVGHLLFERLRDAGVAAVGGLTFGADPVAMAAAFASELGGKPIQAFSIRKTQKDHGIVRWIEGDIQKGARVAIVDDVATTGGSTITAIERARGDLLLFTDDDVVPVPCNPDCLAMAYALDGNDAKARAEADEVG